MTAKGIVKQDEVAANWGARGFSCRLWVDPPAQVWPDFIHETDELVVVLEGRVEFEFGGKTYLPEIGEELLIPRRTSHTVRNVGGTQSRWLYGYRSQ